eukprot:CAMPEP_0198686140 /NCGR_PEP_ID=MMETSP1468-20131203/14541_1 /TAXON_ID=1461545 /ORGANISM="Mantoniella sp, Strain CCMP1436" /LENGTH=51 /DNA_ID=CAMNT_0044432059 /DNA_START=127 /DNA_END=282 /DNA_ORIENTATION=-
MLGTVAALRDISRSSKTLSVIIGSLHTIALGHPNDGSTSFLVQAMLRQQLR